MDNNFPALIGTELIQGNIRAKESTLSACSILLRGLCPLFVLQILDKSTTLPVLYFFYQLILQFYCSIYTCQIAMDLKESYIIFKLIPKTLKATTFLFLYFAASFTSQWSSFRAQSVNQQRPHSMGKGGWNTSLQNKPFTAALIFSKAAQDQDLRSKLGPWTGNICFGSDQEQLQSHSCHFPCSDKLQGPVSVGN